MTLRADLTRRITERLADRPGLVFAVLYGSAARGGTFRDLDIGVWVDRHLVHVDQDLDWAFDLADVLEPLAHVPVDVRVINDAPLPFRYNVSKGQPLVINDRATWYDFLERTWDEWLDFEPVAMQYLRDVAWTK